MGFPSIDYTLICKDSRHLNMTLIDDLVFSLFAVPHVLHIPAPNFVIHYGDVIMSTLASQITGVSMVCSTVCSGADQRKHESSASLAFVGGIHRWPVNAPHKEPVTRKMFPFDDVIMIRPRGCHFIAPLHAWLARGTNKFVSFNSSPPGQNGRHPIDDVFRREWKALRFD